MMTLLLAAGLTFHALPEGAAEFLTPEFDMALVSAEDTPGSAEWYVPFERLRLPVAWRITRNGHTVTNSRGSARIALAPTTGLWPNVIWQENDVRDWYCGYDVANADYVRLPGESAPEPQHFVLASPEMFCLTWDATIGITNYHYSALACSNAEYEVSSLYPGRELFKPKSSRFDSVARSALLASYEAYYERLYYASQGQRNDWESAEWGETGDPQRFDFNPTNSLVATKPRFRPTYQTNDFERANDGALRPVPASRRLTDADNIASLIHHVRDLFPCVVYARALNDDETEPLDDVLDARPFVFRPHWLTDQRDYPRGDRFGARIWWASTIPPPASPQLVWRIGPSDYIESTTLGLFPEFDEVTVGKLYSAGVPFSCYAMTLDMLMRGDGFRPARYYEGPCFNLFNAVFTDCPQASDGRFTSIYNFDPHGLTMPGFLTNCYPRAVASVPNVGDAYARYVDVGTDTTVIRRMVPGRLDLVNELLSVMDRTIMIPSMHITSTNKTRAWRNHCHYQGDESTFEAKWNGNSWEISGFNEQYELRGSPTLTSDVGEEVVDGIRASVSATHSTTNHGRRSFSDAGEISVDESWLRAHLHRPSTNFVDFVGDNMGIYVLNINSGVYDFVGIGDVREQHQSLTFPFRPSVGLTRTYSTSHPASAGNIGIALGPHQPGFEAGELANACTSAVLSVKVTDSLGFDPRWRSEVRDYEPGGLADVLASFGEDRRAEVLRDLEATCGKAALDDAAGYIPLPSSARLVFGENQPKAEGGLSVASRPAFSEKAITNTIYHFTIPAPPGETVNETKRWTTETNLLHSSHVYEVRIDRVFDSNMVETTTVVTNFLGSEQIPLYPSFDSPVSTTIDSIVGPDPSQIELVYTNDYPATVELTGTTTTNTTWINSIVAYDYIQAEYHIIESVTYESDHTRDDVRDWWEVDEHYYPVYLPPATNHTTTTVELTVTNSLPEDALDHYVDVRVDQAYVYTVFIVDADGEPSVWHYWVNPLTEEENWARQSLPYIIGYYNYTLDLTMTGEVRADVGPEHAPFDESVFYRVMTQVDWLWNYMRLEKKDAQ